MQFTILALLGAARFAVADYYDCGGFHLCSTTNVKWCDKAVNTLHRGDPNARYYADGKYAVQKGNCWANSAGYGCRVYVQGAGCSFTGDEMWWAYQDIRNKGGCSRCGTMHKGDGCMVSIDYDSTCDNRDGTLD